jgi:transposase InsO family protein
VAESLFATLKGGLIDREVWPTDKRTALAIAEHISCCYNAKRGHSPLGYMSPLRCESAARRESEAA